MCNREAIDTITGYFYQFDKTILEILKQKNEEALICIEGVEDIDVSNLDETSAIQCKYYAKTEYNHSVIKKPITLMLKHFADNRDSGIKYYLYGHYLSGQEKLSDLSIASLKKNFLTYNRTVKKKKIIQRVYEELKLNDEDLFAFLQVLTVDIHAPSIDAQYQDIIEKIKISLSVSALEAESFHYNAALKLVKDLSLKQHRKHRSISKKDFINKINVKDEIFDLWFLRRKGRQNYIRTLKKQYLSSPLNMEAFERFFLIDTCDNTTIHEIKEAILLIAKKWSKTSKRSSPKFCPSIYLHNLPQEKLNELKNIIFSEGIVFGDAYPFKGSNINSDHFYTQPSDENKIQFRFIDSLKDLEIIIGDAKRTVEIYQFFKKNIFFVQDEHKHIKIKIEEFDFIKELAT